MIPPEEMSSDHTSSVHSRQEVLLTGNPELKSGIKRFNCEYMKHLAFWLLNAGLGLVANEDLGPSEEAPVQGRTA